jgi:hypothetical protein
MNREIGWQPFPPSNIIETLPEMGVPALSQK